MIWGQLPFLLYHSVFTQTREKTNKHFLKKFLVASPTSLGFFYMDRVFMLIVHNFYLCFCSSLISLYSLRHISSQSICGTKPKRPILPTSATGGHVSPRCNGVATLSHSCFSPRCLSDRDSEWGSRGCWESKLIISLSKNIFSLSFVSCLSEQGFSNWLKTFSISSIYWWHSWTNSISAREYFSQSHWLVGNLLAYSFQRQKLETDLKAN